RDVREVRNVVVVALLVVVVLGVRPLLPADPVELVTEVRHRGLEDWQAPTRIVHLERHDLGGDGDLDVLDAVHLAGGPFDLGGAGRAVHAGDLVAYGFGSSAHALAPS